MIRGQFSKMTWQSLICIHTASKYVRQKLIELQGEIDEPAVVTWNINTFYQKWTDPVGRKSVVDLSSTINQLDTVDTYRLFHPTTAQYIFSSRSCGTFIKVDNILGNKAYLKKIKGTEIIQWLFSDHIRIKLEINKRKIVGKS